MQMSATRMALNEGAERDIQAGWVVYIGKESGDIDQQAAHFLPFVDVEEKVATLEQLWSQYELYGELPPQLPPEAKVNRSTKEEFWALFRLEPFVAHLDGVFARLEKLETAQPSPEGT